MEAGPSAASLSRANCCTWAASSTSQAWANSRASGWRSRSCCTACSRRLALRPHRATRAPCDSSRSTVARPMPEEPPVTTAVVSLSWESNMAASCAPGIEGKQLCRLRLRLRAVVQQLGQLGRRVADAGDQGLGTALLHMGRGNRRAQRRHHAAAVVAHGRSEEHTSELQSPCNLVCRLLLEKKKEYN